LNDISHRCRRIPKLVGRDVNAPVRHQRLNLVLAAVHDG
jgi:hypothetical protein